MNKIQRHRGEYPVLNVKKPVLEFYYRGKSHTHPVRRRVVVVEETSEFFRGYEMREGANVRHTLKQAPIKTYTKKKVAKIGEIDRRRAMRQMAGT